MRDYQLGRTPLHYAADNGYVGAIELLTGGEGKQGVLIFKIMKVAHRYILLPCITIMLLSLNL
ncbi:hypothetical protein [Wolbachia endosymbiont of Chironomus riparius]|uniref:hypothetical protein n=1 Tax=Wolbachia endosymbiont of Chironomus riparius TaxID=2883238 RepID=UPI0035198A26